MLEEILVFTKVTIIKSLSFFIQNLSFTINIHINVIIIKYLFSHFITFFLCTQIT
jgi:hypothetical protein